MQRHSDPNYCAAFAFLHLFVESSCNALITFILQELTDICLSLKLDFTSDWTNSVPPEIARPLCPLWFIVRNSKRYRRQRERKPKRKVATQTWLSLQLQKQEHKSPLPSSSLPTPDHSQTKWRSYNQRFTN